MKPRPTTLFPSSSRGMQWVKFAEMVLEHVENYTVTQYGDAPNDNVAKWTSAGCVQSIERYIRRFGSNSRGDMETLRDMLKVAHYACIAHDKYADEMEGRHSPLAG